MLHAFWKAAVAHLQVSGAGGASEGSNTPASTEDRGLFDATLHFASYLELYLRAFRVLLDDYDEAEARTTPCFAACPAAGELRERLARCHTMGST